MQNNSREIHTRYIPRYSVKHHLVREMGDATIRRPHPRCGKLTRTGMYTMKVPRGRADLQGYPTHYRTMESASGNRIVGRFRPTTVPLRSGGAPRAKSRIVMRFPMSTAEMMIVCLMCTSPLILGRSLQQVGRRSFVAAI